MNHSNHNDPNNNHASNLIHSNDQPNNQAHDTDKAIERASKALHKIDQFIPNDNENDMVQAIKHEVLETPAAVISARKDVKDMRNRGRRTLFESRGKNGNSSNGGKAGGKKKDRFLRRRLDESYIASQAAANMLPDEVQDEDSGTKGVRAMVQESAKIVKIFATAESKPNDSKIRHVEDERRLAHENTADSSLLTHEENNVAVLLQHEDSEVDATLQHGDSSNDKKDGNIDGKNDNKKGNANNNKTENRPQKTDNGSKPSTNQDSKYDTSNPSNTNDSQPQSKKDIKIENKLDHNIQKYTLRAEKLEKQVKKAEAKIPKKKVKITKLEHGNGKPKRQISFTDEKIDKANAKWDQRQSMTLSANTGR